MKIKRERLEQLSLHFAQSVCMTLNAMIEVNYHVQDETLRFEPFSTAIGTIALLHFSGTLQGDCILVFSPKTIHQIVSEYQQKICPETTGETSLCVEDFCSELLNTSVGQLMPYMEEDIDDLNYMPPTIIRGKMTFPKVISVSSIIHGDCGDIMCILALNMVSLKIVETLKSVSEDLVIKTNQVWIDSLTGLKNRTCFNEIYRSIIVPKAGITPLVSIMILDVDNLKKINDSLGHRIGDKVLVMVAKTIMDTLRDKDIPCRYGGDEIIIILPLTNSDKTKCIAEHIRQQLKINEKELLEQYPQLPRITLSIGIGQLTEGESPEHLFDRTDKALYSAKNQGRNRIVMSLPQNNDGYNSSLEE